MALTKTRDIGTKRYLIVFAILFGLIFVRYCYFGFEYFYQLDDYIQYHNYTAYNTDMTALINDLGLLSSRPLAGISDLFVWSGFYNVMILAVAVISAMYAGAVVLLHKVFSGHFGTGYFFFVFFALLPMGFEGTYWVSASSRIVVGLFFAALSLFFFDKWCDTGKKSSLILFAVIQFVSFCFYEQVLLFSAAATLVIMLMNIKSRNKRALWGLLMFASAALYFIVTKLASDGVYGARAGFFMPWQDGYADQVFKPALGQMYEAVIPGAGGIIGKGFLRSCVLLISEPNILWVIAAVLLCAGFFLFARKSVRSEIRFFPELLSGLFLAVAPLMVFFVLENPWFGLRNLVTSFCGAALMADAILDLIFGRFRKGAVAEAAIASAVAFLFCIVSVSELYDYRQTTRADTQISAAAYEAVKEAQPGNGRDIWLMNVDASYVKDGNFYFHEHDYGVTGSDWALTGAIRAVSGDGSVPMVTPVSVHRTLTLSEPGQLEKAAPFVYFNGGFTPAELSPDGEGKWLVSSSGTVFGILTSGDGINYTFSMN